MKIPPFKLEEFWKKYEFTAPYLLCCSDAETWDLRQLLSLADPDSLKLWESLALGYTESPGHPLLREEIARLYTSLNAGQVLTFAGAEEGIYCTMRVLIEPDDHVIVIDPCYQSLSTLAETFGAKMTAIQLKPENQWKLDLEEVQKASQPQTKLLVLNYPHNPTGTVLDKEVVEGLIALARKSGAYIFCDEVYRYLEVDETLQNFSEDLVRSEGVLIMPGSVFDLPGIFFRIGFGKRNMPEILKRFEIYLQAQGSHYATTH